MSEDTFDVLIIGAGPGGDAPAIRAAQHGLRTACVERSAVLGGTCTNVGCIPSKALLHASEIYAEAISGKLARLGIAMPQASLDLEAMHNYRKTVVKSLNNGVAYLFRKNKVEWIRGHASFVDRNTVQVDDRTVRAANIVIATGSSVTPLPGVTIDQQVVLDSTGALELPSVPRHLVVVGGGVIGLELGSVWKRLGANVTVVEYFDLPLSGMDADIRRETLKIFKKQGVGFRLSSKVTDVRVLGDTATLTIESVETGASEAIDADAVLVAIGRRPNTDGLGLDRAGLSTNAQGQIEVDAHLRTAVDGIWAIGDVVPGPMLAHKAEDEGIAVADRIAGQAAAGHTAIPSVIYTMPEIAGIGLTEEQARARGEVKVGSFPMLANARAKTNLEPDGFVKVVSDAATDQVLGVWMIAAVAGTMISQAAQAMALGAKSADIARACHPHPTHSEALKEAALAVSGLPLNC
jgi:dihydrolipoamide dehydrogenase